MRYKNKTIFLIFYLISLRFLLDLFLDFLPKAIIKTKNKTARIRGKKTRLQDTKPPASFKIKRQIKIKNNKGRIKIMSGPLR